MRKVFAETLFCCFLLGPLFPLSAANVDIPNESVKQETKEKYRPSIIEPVPGQFPVPIPNPEEPFRRLMKMRGKDGNRPKTVILKHITGEELFKNKQSDFNRGAFFDTEEYFANSNNKDSKEYAELCKMNMIHQVGLNISKFMDLDSFNALMKDVNDKKYKRKIYIVNESVKYFIDKGLTDPIEISSESKDYFLKQGEKAYNEKNYQLAYTYFTSAIEGEKYDSKLKDCLENLKKAETDFRKGSIVFFGKYEQDGNLDNGPEPIEWIVLKKQDNKLTLLSKYVLTHRILHSVEKKFEWPNSELCIWLNNEFYNIAFDENEKKQLNLVGDNIFYLKDYKGDFVVIPCYKDLEDLDYYWHKTYAVPSDKKAKECIGFEEKPIIFEKDEEGNISEKAVSNYRFQQHDKQQVVITSNKKITPDAESVYWPTGFWVNHMSGNMVKRDSDFNRIYYRNYDENAFSGMSAAKYYNGVRPVIKIDCPTFNNKD